MGVEMAVGAMAVGLELASEGPLALAGVGLPWETPMEGLLRRLASPWFTAAGVAGLAAVFVGAFVVGRRRLVTAGLGISLVVLALNLIGKVFGV